ncbi:copper resistance CopC family protein [Cellulosimicrobium sp. Marseille-Q4280]|uniref:copper resistance CopC family protein n=1 Tax=Cellulosimicrobium sp. Marseille-Q4280 TaxID=2937992 RepID=UPI00203EFFC5|nr:copper resistance CopC family protein [Cellulosimicrobium sp. Marseille-Q4280]
MLPARTLTARRPFSALLTALLALLAALALTVVLATSSALPAQAHDRLVGSDPADGAQLDAPPAAITLSFNTEPLAVEPQVVVTDAAGTVVAEGAPTIDGANASLPLDAAALTGGTYSVAWRVVSSDGHPIEGTLSFGVAEQPAAEPAPSESSPAEEATPEESASSPAADGDAGAAEDAATADDGDTDGTDDAAATDDDGGNALPFVIGAVAVVAAAGVATVLVLRRRGGGDDGAGDPRA